ncbi:hypothetical protein C8J98_102638 [Luteibacter sp. OK325]|uniref:hypothetical protein n=1 Tax=Luteibacter sp. OK325 TaxID=2135670 RepID=UPI000D3B7F2F|nr:hypothetical protein [Luteibacter sp. OK325]PTR34450.1 hypothetical protein C8J98_102638 [Luteibacter sp. OK325]
MGAPRRRKLTIIWLTATLVATSSLQAAGDKRAAQKALDDAFANLDQLTSADADPPVSSRWKNMGGLMVLAPGNGGDVRLAAWTWKSSLKTVFGLADGDPKAPCESAPRTVRYKVGGAWLSFDVVCKGGTRVLSPHSAREKRSMYAAVRTGTSLTIVSVRGQKAEFDLRGVVLADAVLRVMAAGALVPREPDTSTFPPAVL